MKLAVIGGAGVRTPLLLSALARRHKEINLRAVVLMDVDGRKLDLMGPLARYVLDQTGADFDLSWTSDTREALSGAGAVITTIRVGSEAGRVLDERIALEQGVLGQETTGPGGFAMALRSIPAVANCARQMRDLCPDAWLLNFTNPAGLVAQALTSEFPELKIAGICDTPISMHRQVAATFGRSTHDVPLTFYGLNHLSWMAGAFVDGENVVPRVVNDVSLLRKLPEFALFDPGLIRLLGMLPNEYLYFYYYREQAVANLKLAAETRGEQIRRLSTQLLCDLERIDPVAHPDTAWVRYRDYLDSRRGTYLASETGGRMHRENPEEKTAKPLAEGGEGYAGVALDILSAAEGKNRTVIANVPNSGALPGMQDDDVVETVCHVDADGIHPVHLGEVHQDALLLMQQVKRYERLSVQAVATRSRDGAVEALMAHPLVGSYSLARRLVEAYLGAHSEFVGYWPDA